MRVVHAGKSLNLVAEEFITGMTDTDEVAKGINLKITRWVEEFLKKRTCRVKLGGTEEGTALDAELSSTGTVYLLQ